MNDTRAKARARVCVIALDTIGDLVLRQPLLTAICAAGHETAVVVRPAYAPLLPILDARLRAIVSGVNPFHPRSLEQEMVELKGTLAAIETFDPDWLIASAFSRTWADEWLLRNVSRARKVGFRGASASSQLGGDIARLVDAAPIPVDRMLDREVAVPPDSPDAVKATRLAELLMELDLDPIEAPRLVVEARMRASADAILGALGIAGRFAVMAAAGTANNALKAMPVELARAAVDHLYRAHGLPTLLIGVESEASHLADVASGREHASVWIGREEELAAMIALVSRAHVYVGADSGPMHVAAACGVPVVAVFGGGHWPRFLPRSTRATTVHNPMPCYGCGWECRWSRPLCITTIQPQYLAQAIDSCLSGEGAAAVVEGASPGFLAAMADVVTATAPVWEERARASAEIVTLHGKLADSDGDRRVRGAQVEQLTGLLQEVQLQRDDLHRQVVQLNAHARSEAQRAQEVDARLSEAAQASSAMSAEVESLHGRLVLADEDRAARGAQIEQLTTMLRETAAHREELHRQVVELNAHARREEQRTMEMQALRRRMVEMEAAVDDAEKRSAAMEAELVRARDEVAGLQASLRSSSDETQRRRETLLVLGERLRAVLGKRGRAIRIPAPDRDEVEDLLAKAVDQSPAISLRHVLVDLTPMLPGGHNGGAKVFVISLLRALAAQSPHTKFTLLASGAVRDEQAGLAWPANVTFDVRDPGRGRTWIHAAQGALARASRRLGSGRVPAAFMRATGWARKRIEGGVPDADVLFCPFTAPYYHEAARPTVCVVYDIQHEVYPQFFTPEQVVERRRSVALACSQSAAVATISDFVRRSLLERGAIGAERLTTIHIRMPHDEPASEAERRQHLDECGLAAERYFLYPANFWPHKNHAMLLTAFALAARRGLADDIKLVLTGEPNARAHELRSGLAAMGLEGRVLLPGFVSPRRLAALRSSALCVAFPSLYEGFGMPLVEAMAAGTPVACGDATALAEVAGDAAAMFDSRDPEAIADVLVRVAGEPDLRETLRQAGRARVVELGTQTQMATQYLELLRRAVAEGGRGVLLRGMHGDGWSGPALTLTYGRGAPDRTVTFDFRVPGWLPYPRVAMSVQPSGRSLEIRTGSCESLRVGLRPDGGEVVVRIRPCFRPDRLSVSNDPRELGVMVEGAVLRSGGEEMSLLDTAVTA